MGKKRRREEEEKENDEPEKMLKGYIEAATEELLRKKIELSEVRENRKPREMLRRSKEEK